MKEGLELLMIGLNREDILLMINLKNMGGRLIHKNGDVYQGDFLKGSVDGFGIYLREDESKYEGYIQNDQQHGKGREEYPDGSIYEGDYIDGLKNGQGIVLENESDIKRIISQFQDNIRSIQKEIGIDWNIYGKNLWYCNKVLILMNFCYFAFFKIII